MDFALSAKAQDYQHRLTEFMTELVLPAEASYHAYREEKGPKDHTVPPVVEDGYLIMPKGPGWGADVNEEALRAHPPRVVTPKR